MTLHTCEKHEPGERSCYSKHACRCTPCRESYSRYARFFNHAHATGKPLRIPGDKVRAHLAALGLTTAEIALRAEIPSSTVTRILSGQRTVSRPIAAKLAALMPDTVQTVGRIDSTGTLRRMQALHALGWSWASMADHMGMARARVTHILDQQVVFIGTANRVREAYDQLWNVTPIAPQSVITKCRQRAARNGWPPPLAWDDDTIDDPESQPQGVGFVQRTKHLVEDVEDLLDAGQSLAAICGALGIKPKSLERQLHRHDRGDLWTKISRKVA
ncbi:MAG: helix-turn-helix transcriptional regulator [Micropruina sp.]|nr:helix-turn-helix transcriptional regulator [Micropruina sp.]